MAKDSTLLLRRLLPAAFLDPFLAILIKAGKREGEEKEKEKRIKEKKEMYVSYAVRWIEGMEWSLKLKWLFV